MEGTAAKLSIPSQTRSPSWFSQDAGIYTSKHATRELPQDPFQDLVSFLFSHEHQGITALIDSPTGFSISYSKLHDMIKSMASGLHNMGISQNQLVLILLPNTILFPIIYLGVLSIGAVATTMNPLSTAEEINKHLGHRKLALVFTSHQNINKLQGLHVPIITVPEKLSSSDSHEHSSSFHQLLSSDPRLAPRPKIQQQDMAILQFSSGTSGLSKGVVITHRNLVSMVELFVRFEASQYERESWKNVYLAAIPMFHVYGLSLFVMGLLSLGTTVVVMKRFQAEEAMRAIDKYKVTHFPLVPPIMAALIRAKGASPSCNMASLIQISSGAAPLSEKIIEDFTGAFPHLDVIQGYGMTETTAVGTRGFNTENLKKYTSAGLLAPNMEAKVVDCRTGSCLPPGRSGELWLRGPAIMKGYLDNEVATSSAIDKDGWLRTGDIAHFDQDGYLYISDRLKDVIKYKGFQIAPADLEAILITHPEVQDAAVTAVEDREVGEIPVAFIVRAMGSKLSSDQVIHYVANQVAPYKKVRKVVFVNSIPRSAAGKILRRLLRNNYGTSKL